MTETAAPGVDRAIYPMPVFVTFPVTDLTASTRWYEALGFVVLATMPRPDGTDALVHLRRLRHQDLLLVPGSPTPGPRVSFAAGEEDLAGRAARVRRAGGAGSVEGPVDTPWFTRDLVATDPDGYVVVLTAPRLDDVAADPAWNATVTGSLGRRPGGS
ncbi:Predicted lactoylglutathione lyase [Geodermatophilus obscurus]|uniref:Predicted lactoylglutathione lyase n=1 Tax=Geodermatophilus obscurus TaxID=1861 RepID=A0A1I5HZG6_9ACTN|nr:VOC family protein [Geodermatophilus obscurus]SFO53181.1 Predicted lactoylglutathione lyase [Geodermatophilus obscurus]